MNDHYTLENLKRAIRNPVLFGREALRLASWPLHVGYGTYTDRKYGAGLDVMEEEWDNLIILDACRYDYFDRLNTIDGTLSKAVSRGKKSWEFLRGNFATGEFHDTVYVTANPFSTDLEDDTFYYIDHLHADRWDEEIGTVRPDDVVDAAIEAHEQYPDKRLIVHFMQPHRPYLGETADELRRRLNLRGYGEHDEGIQIWGAVKQRQVAVREIRDAYTESLEIVLDHTEALLDDVSGKSVVTADHGEMLGERVFPFTTRVWGHMEGFSTPTLREVPWLVIDTDERREITRSDPLQSEENVDVNEVAERLEALGYAG